MAAGAQQQQQQKQQQQQLSFSNRREIGGEAVWSLSSAKPGNGVQQIRDDNVDTYWQSDGGQPHLINIIFNKKVSLMEVAFYLDYNLDESYTPKRMSVRAGNTAHDLEEVRAIDLNEPLGWVSIPLYAIDDNGEKSTLRAFYLQVCVVSMHQNGRDTHIRQAKVFGPRLALNSASGPNFSTVELNQFSTLR